MAQVETDLAYLRDAYLRADDATVLAADGDRVALDRTIFYPTGGGQPHDTGTLTWGANRPQWSMSARDGALVWLTLDGPAPAVGTVVRQELDWERRHALMRTHTALHVLCGVIWNEWGTAVTGGNMEPLSARMDFEFDPLPEGFGAKVEELVNRRAGGRPPDRGVVPSARDGGRRRRPDPHEGQHDPGVGEGDSRRRHRRARQAGRRRHACAHDRTRSVGCASSRPSRRARATSASGSRSSMPELDGLRAASPRDRRRDRRVQRRRRLRVPRVGRERHARRRIVSLSRPRCRHRWPATSWPTAARWRTSGAFSPVEVDDRRSRQRRVPSQRRRSLLLVQVVADGCA